MHHHHLQLGHLLDGVLRAFFAKAAFFEAAVGHEVGAPLGAPVDVEVAAVDFAGEAHGGLETLGEDGGGEAVAAVVGEGDGFVDARGGGESDGGPEELVVRNAHLGIDVGDYGGGVESALASAAGDDAGAAAR